MATPSTLTTPPRESVHMQRAISGRTEAARTRGERGGGGEGGRERGTIARKSQGKSFTGSFPPPAQLQVGGVLSSALPAPRCSAVVVVGGGRLVGWTSSSRRPQAAQPYL